MRYKLIKLDSSRPHLAVYRIQDGDRISLGRHKIQEILELDLEQDWLSMEFSERMVNRHYRCLAEFDVLEDLEMNNPELFL